MAEARGNLSPKEYLIEWWGECQTCRHWGTEDLDTRDPHPCRVLDGTFSSKETHSWGACTKWDSRWEQEAFALLEEEERSEPSQERYLYSLVDVCGSLHGASCGTGDSLSDEELARLRGWLEYRLRNWMPSHSHWERYENAIRELCQAALAELASKEQE